MVRNREPLAQVSDSVSAPSEPVTRGTGAGPNTHVAFIRARGSVPWGATLISMSPTLPQRSSWVTPANEVVAVELRGRPDNTSALHRWDGTTCGTASRCKFTMSGPVVATVHLQ